LEFNVPFQHKYGYIRDEYSSHTRLYFPAALVETMGFAPRPVYRAYRTARSGHHSHAASRYPLLCPAASRCVQASAAARLMVYASLAASLTNSWSHLWSL